MFDTTQIRQGAITNAVTFNSVAGTLVKSASDSKIVKFHMSSPLAKGFFHTDPNRDGEIRRYDIENRVSILQIMLCGEELVLVEYIDLKVSKDD